MLLACVTWHEQHYCINAVEAERCRKDGDILAKLHIYPTRLKCALMLTHPDSNYIRFSLRCLLALNSNFINAVEAENYREDGNILDQLSYFCRRH